MDARARLFTQSVSIELKDVPEFCKIPAKIPRCLLLSSHFYTFAGKNSRYLAQFSSGRKNLHA
jgi:hypothetical protein